MDFGFESYVFLKNNPKGNLGTKSNNGIFFLRSHRYIHCSVQPIVITVQFLLCTDRMVA